MTAEKTEIDVIDPQSDLYVLEDGFQVKVVALRTRQMLKLMRIITRGAAPILEDVGSVLMGGDEDELGGRLIGLMLFAIPEAENETMEFLQAMVQPADIVPGSSKLAREKNLAAQAELEVRMDNPSLNDMFGLVRLIISRESGELANLGKQLSSALTGSQTEEETPTAEQPEPPSESKTESKKTSKS